MEKELNTTNGSDVTAKKSDGKEDSYIQRKLRSKLRFWLSLLYTIIVLVIGMMWGYHLKRTASFSHTLKFMKQKEELAVEQFPADPINFRDWAWDSESLPGFIESDFTKADMLGYDGVEYFFGENKIRVQEETFSYELELIVNDNYGWSMDNFSIYSYGENIVIYGYWNKEFRRITLGKTEDSVVREVLTLDPGVPFSANSKYITKDAKSDYIFVISEDMRTVSAYSEEKMIGNEVVLPDEILGFYDGIMILAKADDHTDKLYMPYIVDNNGEEEFVCMEVAVVTAEEVKNVSTDEYLDSLDAYTTKYSAKIGYICCYIFENDDGVLRMIIPNSIQKYAAYRRGTDVLTPDDDLGWHWIIINE